MSTDDDILAFLQRQATVRHVEATHGKGVAYPMVVFGELHFQGDGQKARFFAQLVGKATTICPPNPAFHASERFDDTLPIQAELESYLRTGGGRLATRALKTFQPLLDAAAKAPDKGFAVLCAGNASVHTMPARHAALLDALNRSIQRRNAYASPAITSDTHGSILLGNHHAARVEYDSTYAGRTTCQRLEEQWGSVYVITVYADWQKDGTPPEEGAEGDEWYPMGDKQERHLFPILRQVAGGKSFLAEIRGQSSVFSNIRHNDISALPFDKLFDAILYLND
jgi:hypothetical protein